MNELKQKIISVQQYKKNLKNYLKKMNKIKEIIIWGASESGEIVYEFLKEVNLDHKVIGFTDNASQKWGGVFNNLKVLSPSEVIEKAKIEDYLCIINAVHILEIKEQLISQGINEKQIDMEGYFIANPYVVEELEMTIKERMIAELPFSEITDKEILELLRLERQKLFEFNTTNPNDDKKLKKIMSTFLGKINCLEEQQYPKIRSPFHCDFGYNIEVGKYFFANYNCMIFSQAKVIIGDNVQLGPNVVITTVGHPVYPTLRNYTYGITIIIGNNVWIGANSVVLPGIHIGNNVVIGAGSIVTKDIADNVVAAGNPCKVIRKITKEDRKYYYKNRKFNPYTEILDNINSSLE